MPSRPPRGVGRCVVASVVLALLAALAPAVAAAPAGGSAAGSGPAAEFAAAVDAGGRAARVADLDRAGGEHGPACAPGSGRQWPAPAVPVRGGGEHGQVPVARAVPAGVRVPGTTPPAGVLVRGPGARAPDPVEFSVMRV